MNTIDKGVGYPIVAPGGKLRQFSLRGLLLLVLAISVCLALFRLDPLLVILFLGGLLTAAMGMQRDFWRRFRMAFAIMIGVNLLPLYCTWNAYGTDGFECVGWPFTFFKRGMVSVVNPLWFVADLWIAALVAYFAAKAIKDGWRVLFHRMRTWGIEHHARQDDV